jgi:hypothetical protein
MEGQGPHLEGRMQLTRTQWINLEGSTPQRFSRQAQYNEGEVARQQWYYLAVLHFGSAKTVHVVGQHSRRACSTIVVVATTVCLFRATA